MAPGRGDNWPPRFFPCCPRGGRRTRESHPLTPNAGAGVTTAGGGGPPTPVGAGSRHAAPSGTRSSRWGAGSSTATAHTRPPLRKPGMVTPQRSGASVIKGWGGILQKIPSNVQSMAPRPAPAAPSGRPGRWPAGLRAAPTSPVRARTRYKARGAPRPPPRPAPPAPPPPRPPGPRAGHGVSARGQSAAAPLPH